MSKKTILVVDDEILLREILRDEFEDAGFAVIEAENGRKAFDLIGQHKIALVVSDVRMPGGDGLELLDRVVAMGAGRPPLILVSGFSDITAADAQKRGAVALLGKPYDFDLLNLTVKKAVGEG